MRTVGEIVRGVTVWRGVTVCCGARYAGAIRAAGALYTGAERGAGAWNAGPPPPPPKDRPPPPPPDGAALAGALAAGCFVVVICALALNGKATAVSTDSAAISPIDLVMTSILYLYRPGLHGPTSASNRADFQLTAIKAVSFGQGTQIMRM